MKTDKNQHTNPNSIKTKFAFLFLRAVKKLRKTKLPNPQPTADKHKRYHLIKTAAYASMASAVGPRRAWSRAVLRTVRNHKLNHTGATKKSRTRNHHVRLIRRKRVVIRGKPRVNHSGFEQENELRELVPGGEEMDLSRLLCETAHYIKCLRAQVQVMKNIVHHYSN